MTKLRHVALIPDGNRRWAKQRGKLPWKGHEEGVERFRETTSFLREKGIPFVTFWAGSESNLLKRAAAEVKVLARLFKDALEKEVAEQTLTRNETRLRLIGRWREILKDKGLNAIAKKLENRTAEFKDRNLTVLFGYSGNSEMREGIRSLIESKKKITDENIHQSLWTHDLPPVDLIIRTGGEPHWSAGFMMWLAQNSQLYFTETLWPDFGRDELEKALAEYAARGRRFGK